MTLRLTLFQIAAVLSVAACPSGGSGTDPSTESDAEPPSDAGRLTDSGGRPDVDSPEPSNCRCNCDGSQTLTGEATPEEACALVAEFGQCELFCARLPGSDPQSVLTCAVSGDYASAYRSAQPDGSSSADGGRTCPTWTGKVVVQCGPDCTGRRTEGILDPPEGGDSLGSIFANRAYLEAVSAHAFARLERELVFHGAPSALVRATRQAQREEIRHTAIAARLARRFGGTLSLPRAPNATPARDLFAIARENAVEGCVRETYGAVMGLREANMSCDAEVRAAATRIAMDECGHAELAMTVARWIAPRLTESERVEIRAAVDEAIADLAAQADARVVALLNERVWSVAA